MAWMMGLAHFMIVRRIVLCVNAHSTAAVEKVALKVRHISDDAPR